ncbi:uncharacterized protein BXIN_2784 [Babesia sp. Xinjiang]|uniref:uncharacterized protein n=1 Tax=Babesia sp. Xinjiang TaxID=462227 RepID=UPI000A2272EA|nr:uncharacterized protein BXIN_2784 [Babesia sp. Xinjiang]ORM41746.1 hypothetical protein BXIN_2784 [Babesia sp. Xinjiang]
MAFDHLESPAGTEFNSRCQRTLSLTQEYKDGEDSDSVESDSSVQSANSSTSSNSDISDSISTKLSDISDVCTPVSAGYAFYDRDALKPVKSKSVKDLECEETLKRLHSLAVGDIIYFRRSVLAACLGLDPQDHDGYMEGKVTCFSYCISRRYVVVTVEGCGCLRFTFGDLYNMSIDRNLHLQRLQHPSVLARALRHKRQRYDYDDDYPTRRSWSSQLCTEDSDNFSSYDGFCGSPYSDSVDSPSYSFVDRQDVSTRPIPPGADMFCKCRFVNRLEFTRLLREIIYEDEDSFNDKTAEMQELRLILTQNVRPYELEIIAYLLGEDPWNYSANPYDRPNSEQINDIIEQYAAAVLSPEYVALYEQWQTCQRTFKSDSKMAEFMSDEFSIKAL